VIRYKALKEGSRRNVRYTVVDINANYSDVLPCLSEGSIMQSTASRIPSGAWISVSFLSDVYCQVEVFATGRSLPGRV
jgi:hypothetical protein